MQAIWLITNPGSGSTSVEKCAGIEAAIEEVGFRLAGRTLFPDEPLPERSALMAAGVDMVVLFAGDGTINAAACALDDWQGRMLILPGGTMNMLSRLLHGDAQARAIVHGAAMPAAADISLPFVEAGPHRAFVALIAGPVAAWAHAREAARAGHGRRFLRAVRLAWLRSFAKGVHLDGRAHPRGDQRAVVIMPDREGMEVSAIGLGGWMAVARLGFGWLSGDWRSARDVSVSRPAEVTLRGGRAIHALFDGEEVKLASPVTIRRGTSRLRFVTTQIGAAA
jgi:diacylglycerol kinase family enzyme